MSILEMSGLLKERNKKEKESQRVRESLTHLQVVNTGG